MDKYEYKVRADEIKSLIADGEYAKAVKIADAIDWRRVKSVMMLCTISDLYKINRRYQESKDILLLAYERHPGGRLIVYSLCELSIKLEEYVQALEYYKEFVRIAPKDSGRYVLQYKLYEAQDVGLEERIAVLEELKKHDYREKWAYELAYLYHRVGLATKCVEECDEMFLWFGDGKYVMKALELKSLHEPLTEEQKEKYARIKYRKEVERGEIPEAPEEEGYAGDGEGSLYPEDASYYPEAYPENYSEETYPAETYSAENYAEETYSAESYSAEEFSTERFSTEKFSTEKFSDDTGPDSAPAKLQEAGADEEQEIQVKPVDVGQYNTVNLQKLLAEGMKDIMEEPEGMQPVDSSFAGPSSPDEGQEDEGAGPGPITQAIIAPLLQDTVEISPRSKKEEIFFGDTNDMTSGEADPEESGNDSRGDSGKEAERLPDQDGKADGDNADAVARKVMEEIREKELARKEKQPNVTPFPGTVSPERLREAVSVSKPAPEAAGIPPITPAASAHILPKGEKTTGFERMLSQEYDGQISLVVPDSSQVEKQITGQLSLDEIMAEWEKTKRQNEEKRKEDVRKRVLEQTGNLFAEFDEATKSGLLERLEKAVVEAILKETGGRIGAILPEGADTDRIAAEAQAILEKEARSGGKAGEAGRGEGETAKTDSSAQEGEQETAIPDKEWAEVLPKADSDAAEVSETSVETADTESPEDTDAPAETRKTGDAGEERGRSLTEEEREIFGPYIHHRKCREQILDAIENISLAAYTGNVIVTGEEGSGTINLAKGLIREIQQSDGNFSGKVAKISGGNLNKKDVKATLSRLANGALIVEKAHKMNEATADKLTKALEQENNGLIVILEGTPEAMNKFMDKNSVLAGSFNVRVDIQALDDGALVAFAREYAQEQEYSIDDLGVLALHTRIAEMQTSDHEVTVSEVKEIVDEAIYYADRKTPRHFFDILFGKRYDEEDMIILRERDFMHY